MPGSLTVSKPWSTLCAWAVAALAFMMMAWRMLHGIDTTDDSFYVAIPLRFAMGERPFVDDLSIAQTAGLLLYPFVKAYLVIAGTTGIFLFIRILYLAFFVCVGWSAYALARPRVPQPAALLIATACVCYIPYSMPSLGYNTITVGLFSIGLFTIASSLLAGGPPRPFWKAPIYWAGFAHGAACFAYPTLVLSALLTAASLTALATGRRARATVMYCLGGASFLLLMMPLLASAGLAQLRAVVHYTSGDSPSGGFTFAIIAERWALFRSYHPELPLAAGLALVAALAVRRLPRATAVALVLVPLLARGSTLTGYLGSVGFVAGFALLGPLLAVGIPDRRSALVLVLGVAAPSMLAGLVWSLSSGNGALAAGIGLFPAAIVTALVLMMNIDGALASTTWARFRPILALSPALLVGLLLQYIHADDAYYRDGPADRLTARMPGGPFWGLYTTPEKAKLLQELSADLHEHRGGSDARLYCNIPAAYIIAERRPLVAAAWIFAAPGRVEIDFRFLLTRIKPGDLIVRTEEHDGVLGQFFAATSELVARRPTYDVLLYRGFGRSADAVPAPGAALPFDEWRGVGDGQGGDALLAYGWSWPERWGRWSASRHTGLILLRPEGPPTDTIVKLDLVAHVSRAVKEQRFKIRVGETMVAEGAVPAGGATVELVVPKSLAPQGAIYLSLEIPDAQVTGDARLLGLGLKRVMISSKAGG